MEFIAPEVSDATFGGRPEHRHAVAAGQAGEVGDNGVGQGVGGADPGHPLGSELAVAANRHVGTRYRNVHLSHTSMQT